MPEINKPLTDEEYVRRLGMMYEKILSLRQDSDYVVNQPQMDKLVELLDYFIKMTKQMDGTVAPMNLKPSEEHGDITARFWFFSVAGADIMRFCKVIQYCSALSVDAVDTGEVRISCTIPNVFVPKS